MKTESTLNMTHTALPYQNHGYRYLCEFVPDLTTIAEKPVPLKFWETDHMFTCPVIGTCLTFNEQKHLLKRVGISIKRKSHFEIHEILVTSSKKEGRLSRRIDGLLNRKFKEDVDAFFELDERKFLRLWNDRFKDGKIAAVLWLAAIKPDLSSKARISVFGDLHMEMHMGAGKIREDRSRMHSKDNEYQNLVTDLNETQKTARLLRKDNERLKKEISDSCRKNDLLEKERGDLKRKLSDIWENSPLSTLQAENRDLQADLNRLVHELTEAQQKIKALEKQNARLSSGLEKQRALNDSITIELKKNITYYSSQNNCNESCPSFDLCRKRILLVGGISRIEALYRRMIEDRGGVFEYHDGHMKGGTKNLENRVKRADMVICPTNCNSHGACLTVKKLGKKHSKPIHMLSNSGLNSIVQALYDYQENVGSQ